MWLAIAKSFLILVPGYLRQYDIKVNIKLQVMSLIGNDMH